MAYAKAESEIKLGNGCTVRCPAYPEACSYVRVVDAEGVELAYWDSAEWAEAPEEVMGSIMGAIIGGG